MSGRFTIPESDDSKELLRILNDRLEEIDQALQTQTATLQNQKQTNEDLRRAARRRASGTAAGAAGARPGARPAFPADDVRPPTDPTLEVIPQEGNYILRNGFTKPVPLGTSNEWDVQAAFWKDSLLTDPEIPDAGDPNPESPEANWMQLGITWEDALVTSPQPRPTDSSRWVKNRVRSKNTATGAVSAWVENTAAEEVTAYTDSYVPPDPAGVPTGVTASAVYQGGKYGFAIAWVSGGGGTTDFETRVAIWRDDDKTQNDIDADDTKNFIALGGTDALFLNTSHEPRPKDGSRWAEVSVRARNAANEYSDWSTPSALFEITVLDLPDEPASVTADAFYKDNNYGIAASWPAGGGTTIGYHVRVYIWTENDAPPPTYVNDIDADNAKNYIVLGEPPDLFINAGGNWARPTDKSRFAIVRVYGMNEERELSASYAESAMFEIEVGSVPGVEPPAPNVDAVTATVAVAEDKWGFTGQIDWPADTSNIDYARAYVIGPIGTPDELRKPWAEFIPSEAVGGLTDFSQALDWQRPGVGEASQQYRIEVEVYNSANVPSASPTSSAPFTVTAMVSLQVTNLTAARNPTIKSGDGVEVYGVLGSYTVPNSDQVDRLELTIVNLTDSASRETLFTKTGDGGGYGGQTIDYATDLWPIWTTTFFDIRITVYIVNSQGVRLSNPATATIRIIPGGGSLDLGRADSTSLGKGLGKTATAGKKLVGTATDGLILLNPGFEALDGTLPKDWTCEGSVAADNLVKESGDYSCRIVKTPGVTTQVYQDVRHIPGALYRLAWKVRNDGPSSFKAGFSFRTEAGEEISYASITIGVQPGVWQTLHCKALVIPSTTIKLRVVPAYMDGSVYANTTAWIDHVKIEQIVDNEIIEGDFIGHGLFLDLGGVETAVANELDSYYGDVSGLRVQLSGEEQRSLVTAGGAAGLFDDPFALDPIAHWEIAGSANGGTFALRGNTKAPGQVHTNAEIQMYGGLGQIMLRGSPYFDTGIFIYDGITPAGFKQVLNSRYPVLVSNLKEVIDCLKWHKLCRPS